MSLSLDGNCDIELRDNEAVVFLHNASHAYCSRFSVRANWCSCVKNTESNEDDSDEILKIMRNITRICGAFAERSCQFSMEDVTYCKQMISHNTAFFLFWQDIFANSQETQLKISRQDRGILQYNFFAMLYMWFVDQLNSIFSFRHEYKSLLIQIWSLKYFWNAGKSFLLQRISWK